jgi:MFS superfamily sulfate permease-like transporter
MLCNVSFLETGRKLRMSERFRLIVALTIMDLKARKDFFVAAIILGITLASNLAAGFITGIAVAHILKWEKLSV